jgi:hypothetical protein
LTWLRVDDRAWSNEKLLSLSHEAFRLLIAVWSLVAQGWPDNQGCLTCIRAEGLAQWHHIVDPAAAINELVAKRCLEKRARGLLHVHDIDEFLPSAELSAARSAAGRRGGIAKQRNKAGTASATDLPQQNPSTPSRPVPSRISANALTPLKAPQRGAVHLHPDIEGFVQRYGAIPRAG